MSLYWIIRDRMSCARSTIQSHRFPKTSIPCQVIKRLRPTAVPARPRFSVCMSAAPPSSPPIVNRNASLPHKHAFPSERIEYLVEKTARKLERSREAAEKLKLIDNIQRLGIGHYFEDLIDAVLHIQSSAFSTDQEDLFTTALRFRLLRHNGFQITPEVFLKFKDKSGNFKEPLGEDTLGLLSLYEASNMGGRGEEILEEALEFTASRLRGSLAQLPPHLHGAVAGALEVPRHLRMARLEARRFIEEYAKQTDCDRDLLQLATLDYNKLQDQHQMELTEITRWWRELGLVEKLSFARDRPLECFLWSVGLLPEPKYSSCRIELAKAISILLVIDDIFDTYGKMDELILFTHAIRRWDLEAMSGLPEYMKISYMALYNTTNETCYKVLKESGKNALPYLKSTWIDMIEGFMIEAKWFNGGNAPKLEEYIENGVSTSGAYMALVHLFFLIGEGVTHQNSQLLSQKPYPELFSSAGRVLRLWDDLGTSKEEQERGDLASSILLYLKENELATEEEARSRVLEEIARLWKDLNGELISNKELPLPIIKAALNMARASQVVYNHQHDTYFSSVDNYVETLFHTPLN